MSRNRLAERKGNYPEFKEGFIEFKSGSQFAEFGNMNIMGGLGGGGSRIPFKFDSILWLDGAVLQDESTYYMLDKSGNSRHFLITNYDFPENWSGGFPYKSAATISAPVGDAALIAADVNNFFYDSGGTPNQIPVVSFFQNVDYANRLFCRHQDQLLDVNGVETFEPRVKEIVLYANAKTGADLTKCNSYYSVPEKLTTGIREVGAGKTYTTISAAITAASIGETVYVNTGIYSEALTINKNIIIKCVGNVKLLAGSVTSSITISLGSVGTPIIEGFIIDNTNATSYGIRYTGNTTSITINRCKTINSATKSGFFTTATNACVLNISNSIFESNSLISSIPTNISNCYLKLAATSEGLKVTGANNYNVSNSKIFGLNAGFFTISANATINVLGGYIENSLVVPTNVTASFTISRAKIVLNKSTQILASAATGTSIDYTIRHCDIRQTFASYLNTFTNLIVFKSLTFEDNVITGANLRMYAKPTTASTVSIKRNVASNCTALLLDIWNCNTSIEGNIFEGQQVSIWPNNSGVAIATPTTIKNNIVFSRIEGEVWPLISLGNEVNGFEYENGSEISGNYLRGPIYYGNTGGTHGLAVFWQKNILIKNNYVEGCPLGIVVKADGRDVATDVNYNIIKNCQNGLILKGSQNVRVYGNTILRENGVNASFLIAITNNETAYSPGCLFKNNLLIDKQASSVCQLIQIADTQSEVGFVSNNNQFESTYASPFYASTGALSLVSWKTKGYDNSSQLGSVSLTNLWPTTPITIGENLGTDYDDGLDITTNWGSETTVPSVVTKQQTGTWQVGAFVQ